MIIAVVSCWKYRDAWMPFFALLDKFWPDHPETVLLSDHMPEDVDLPNRVRTFCGPNHSPWTWCQTVEQFANAQAIGGDEPILLMQEDFFITAPVKSHMVYHGLFEMKRLGAVSVRLYPCPGANAEYGDSYFGKCSEGAPYRVSCQATIWKPSILARFAELAGDSAVHFEVIGNRYAHELGTVLAFKREALPPNQWPLQYICSGISQGRWNPDSKKLFEKHGISADYSMRAMAPA